MPNNWCYVCYGLQRSTGVWLCQEIVDTPTQALFSGGPGGLGVPPNEIKRRRHIPAISTKGCKPCVPEPPVGNRAVAKALLSNENARPPHPLFGRKHFDRRATRGTIPVGWIRNAGSPARGQASSYLIAKLDRYPSRVCTSCDSPQAHASNRSCS
jgi:hypothetical protein